MQFEYETQRLILKILRPEAAPMVLNFYLRDKELFEQFEPDRPLNFYSISHQKNMLKYEYTLAIKLSSIRFYVFRKEDPQTVIGTFCFHNIQKSLYASCELGYKFSSQFHHHGYATEALQKGITIIFEELQLHRICAYALPDNHPSIRLLTRLGFDMEGLCKGFLPMRGKWMDHLQFALLSDRETYESRIPN